MNRAMYAAASGMAAQQKNLDVVADNLANADVMGFKNSVASFAALGSGAALGTAQTGTYHVFTQGKLVRTGGPFDVAIDGPGFFQVERDGQRGYTRAGAFSRASDGSLQNSEHWKLVGVRVPAEAIATGVAPDGRVSADLSGGRKVAIGAIRLVVFDAPEKLRQIGSAVFCASAESGRPRPIAAGETGRTKLVFGELERSNVSIVESMMAILAAQRAYEANAKGVQAADEMLRIANNIHRS